MNEIERIYVEQREESIEQMREQAIAGIELRAKLPSIIKTTIRGLSEEELERIRTGVDDAGENR
jgi:hypothetical protein